MLYRRSDGTVSIIDAYVKAAELTDCALGLEEQRLALNKIVDRRMAAEIPLAQ
jgi:hypothetical protein